MSEPANDAKLAELILYVSDRCADDPRFGATKLNKILFYADFIAYGKLGKPITGQAYQKLKFGPAPRRLMPVRDGLIAASELAIQSKDHFGKGQKRTVALREANLSQFSGDEIAIVEDMIKAFWDANATEASEASHRTCAWKYADEGEDIPYESVFLSDRPLTERELAHAVTLA